MTFAERHVRWLLTAAVVLIGLGLWFFVLRGADQPADPELGDVRRPFPGFAERGIEVQPAGGGDLLTWCLMAALDEASRARGLMGVTDPDLQGYDGMAFVYPDDVRNSFYMKDTLLPLSIAWLDSVGEVVTITDMEPCGSQDPCPTYGPSGPYRTAIEVPQGRLPSLGITEGARVTTLERCPADA